MPIARVLPANLLLVAIFLAPMIWAMGLRVQAQVNQDKGVVPIVPPVLRLAPLSKVADSPVVTALAIDPTGNFAAAAGDDHVTRMFSLNDLTTPFPESSLLDGHRDWVQAIEFSPNGMHLATCAKDGRLQVWKREPSTLNPESPLGQWRKLWSIEVPHAFFSLKFVSNNTLLAAGFDPAIYRLDLEKLQWGVDHRSESADVRTLTVSSDGTKLAYGGRDGVVRIRTLDRDGRSTEQGAISIAAHNHRIRGLCFSENHAMLYSVGEDRRLVGIDLATQSVAYQNDLAAGRLMAIERLSDDRFAVSGSDNTIRIVEPKATRPDSASEDQPLETRILGIKLIGHDGTIAVLRASGDHLFSGSFDTTIRSWDIPSAVSSADAQGRFVHPISAQYEDSSARERIR